MEKLLEIATILAKEDIEALDKSEWEFLAESNKMSVKEYHMLYLYDTRNEYYSQFKQLDKDTQDKLINIYVDYSV